MTTNSVEKEIREKLLTLLGNTGNVDLWLSCPNPNFGGTKPITLIKIGRGDKVLLFIEAAIKGY